MKSAFSFYLPRILILIVVKLRGRGRVGKHALPPPQLRRPEHKPTKATQLPTRPLARMPLEPS